MHLYLSLSPLASIQSVVITVEPDFAVQLRDSLTLACSVVATGLSEIAWSGSRVTNTTNQVFTNVSAGTSTLTIPVVFSADLGDYLCQATAGANVRNATITLSASSK